MSPWWRLIEDALQAHDPPELEAIPPRRSSVAAIIDFRPAPHVLLMKRVMHERDPWSGHVSLPGGRSEPEDSDLIETAVRETREEVAIDLQQSASLLGRLAPRRATSSGKPHDMDVTPFVFRLEQAVEPIPLEEAEALFWLPLDRAADGELDAEHSFERDQVIHKLPAWEFEGFKVWGMTHRILQNLITVCRSC